MSYPQNEYGQGHSDALGQAPAPPPSAEPEITCQCPSCAASLSVAAENAENIKVQCMVCGTIFSPLGDAPAPPVAAPGSYRPQGFDEPAPRSYAPPAYTPSQAPPPQAPAYSPDPYRPNINQGGFQSDPYSEFYPNAYPASAPTPPPPSPYPETPYTYRPPAHETYAPPADPYMEQRTSGYRPPVTPGGYAESPYYNAPPAYRGEGYHAPAPYGSAPVSYPPVPPADPYSPAPPADPYLRTQAYGGYAPPYSPPARPAAPPAPIAPPMPMTPPAPQVFSAGQAPGIQQMAVRSTPEPAAAPAPQAAPPESEPKPEPASKPPKPEPVHDPVVTEKPSALSDEVISLRKADSTTREALTGSKAPVEEVKGDGSTAQAFKLVKSEYDYYMKNEEPEIRKKGSFFKILLFMFLPLVAIGWSVWNISSRENLILYAAVTVVCFVIFILALVAYNRNCPHCGRWSALVKEHKEDQYGKYVQLQCKHCDYALEAQR